MELFFLLLCGVSLFGSLGLSSITGDGIYFLIGYPVAVVALLVASYFRRNRR